MTTDDPQMRRVNALRAKGFTYAEAWAAVEQEDCIAQEEDAQQARAAIRERLQRIAEPQDREDAIRGTRQLIRDLARALIELEQLL